MNQERLDQIEKRLEELYTYKKEKDFTDPRLDYIMDCEIERLEGEAEDILYGTHNLEIMELKQCLELSNSQRYSPRCYYKVYLNHRIEQLKDQIADLIEEDNNIRKNIPLVRRKHNV